MGSHLTVPLHVSSGKPERMLFVYQSLAEARRTVCVGDGAISLYQKLIQWNTKQAGQQCTAIAFSKHNIAHITIVVTAEKQSSYR